MKAFKLNAVINSIRAKVDGSLGLTISTPELTPTYKAGIMELQGINIDLFMQPLDSEPEDIIKIDKDLEQKTLSQRLRAVLFIEWKQKGEIGDFKSFYDERMLKYIDHAKSKLEPEA